MSFELRLRYILILIIAIAISADIGLYNDYRWRIAYGNQQRRLENRADLVERELAEIEMQQSDDYYRGAFDICNHLWSYVGITNPIPVCLRMVQKINGLRWYEHNSPGYISPVTRRLKLSGG